ncbi:MAG: hypothetical protein GY809_04560, partial [Planctomycetes bacterium]|nr:hypothetical protein [Planctomycetota bacterium]
VATYWYANDNAVGNGEVTPDKVRTTVGDLTGGQNLGMAVPSQMPSRARATMDNGL